MIEYLIVGSGPTGIAAARRLLALGKSVTLVDGGENLDDERSGVISELSLTPFASWTKWHQSSYEAMLRRDDRIKSHAGSKLQFGSTYVYTPYSQLSSKEKKVESKVGVFSSLSVGGLSNVWGSIVFPYSNRELDLLKHKIDSEHYEFIETFLPISGHKDNLSEIYREPKNLKGSLKFSNLNSHLVCRFSALRDKLPFQVYGGSPRVAVYAEGSKACQSCGLCATGCVWSSIWSARDEISDLTKQGLFTYKPGVVIEKLFESLEGVAAIDFNGDSLMARKVFLACGPLSTTRILHSSEMIPDVVQLSDTQLTLLPCLKLGMRQTSENFVLSQFIVNIPDNQGLTEFFVQITGFNEDLYRRVRELKGFLRIIPRSVLNAILKRMSVAMIFQKATSSGSIRISRTHDQIVFEKNTTNLQSLFSLPLFYKTQRILKDLGLIPLKFFTQVVDVGESYHVGNLVDLQDKHIFDDIGRVNDNSNVHILDSCSLTYLAPGPITFTTMANAVRIVDTLS